MEFILKGILAGIVFWFIHQSIKRNSIKGKLFFGQWMLWLGIACTIMAIAPIYSYMLGNKDYGGIILVFIMFGMFALASFLEYKYTRSNYNKHKIILYTPWSGLKTCIWTEIDKITYSDSWHWYIFHCKNGKKMRFSSYLTGIDKFIDYTNQKNIKFEI